MFFPFHHWITKEAMVNLPTKLNPMPTKEAGVSLLLMTVKPPRHAAYHL
jgi:hypothetical protein